MKPLPPNNAGPVGGDPNMQSQGAHGGSAGPNSASDRFGAVGSQQPSNGAVPPTRHATLPPTVVISPSGAPVCPPRRSRHLFPGLITCCVVAHPTAWCS